MDTALTFVVFIICACITAEPSVRMMQILAPDKDAVSQTGFVSTDGDTIVSTDKDVDIKLCGSEMDVVTHVAFTPDESKPGVRDVFGGETIKFPILERDNYTAHTKLHLGSEWTGKVLYMVVFTTGDKLPLFQGLVLRVQDLSSLFLPLWVQIPMIVLLLCLSSLFSGLNLGLMSLDKTGLKILKECGSESEKRYAKAIEPLRKHGNYLLCTLLLGNVLVNTTLTLLLDQLIGSGLIAVVFSTLAIVIFGEIIPQAVCSRYGLMVGARTRHVTIIFMALTGAISWPLSKLLDCVLGQEIGTLYTRDKLSKLVEVQRAAMDIGDAEVDMLTGVLRMRNKKAEDIMTPIEDVFMVSYDAVLDFNILSEIFTRGFSRIPVYDGEKTNVVNVLNVKDIAFLDPDDKVPLKAILKTYAEPPSPVLGLRDSGLNYNVGATDQIVDVVQPHTQIVTFEAVDTCPQHVVVTTPTSTKQHDANLILRIDNDMALDRLLQRFLEKRCHMGFVFCTDDSDPARDPVHELIGLVTLEDLFEEIIQREILDEGDVQDRRGNVVKRRRAELREFNAPGPVSLSPGLQLAAYQFLSTTELFHPELVSQRILTRLLKHKLVEEHDYLEYNTSVMDYEETGDRNYLYRPDRGVDYFVLILQGHTDVQVGRENMKFDGGPFQVFGEEALMPINELLAKYPKYDIRQLAKLVQAFPKYKPDFKVRASTDLQYVKVDRATYLALRMRTMTIKQLPSTTVAQAIAVDTDELILKDVEIARNPDTISQSPTMITELTQPPDCPVSHKVTASAPRSTIGPRTESVSSTGAQVNGLASRTTREADLSAAGAAAALNKTGKTFMKSRNSMINASNSISQTSPNATRRTSVGDASALQNSEHTLNDSAPQQESDPAYQFNDAFDSSVRLARPESLPSAFDCYINAGPEQSDSTRLLQPSFEDRKPRSRTEADADAESSPAVRRKDSEAKRTGSGHIKFENSDDDET